MGLKTFIAKQWAKRRIRAVQRWSAHPAAQQRQVLQQLVRTAANTAFGKDHDFAGIRPTHLVAGFQARVPVRSYEELLPYVERAVAGEADVLWPGKPLYFAKTSGTTAGAKYIPLTKESVPMHVKGARDALFFYLHQTGNAAFLNGKMIFLSGSPELEQNPAGIPVGRLSGIVQHFVPRYLQRNRVPTFATNSIPDWEQKVDAIIAETKGEDLRLVSGIPPWVQQYFERLREVTGKAPAEIWPNLRVFVHGGVDYRPYAPLIQQAFGRDLDLVETYPASEGFIAVQNDRADDGLLLMLDYGIFYEFIPLSAYGQPDAPRLTLDQVETNVDYAVIMSTNAGLWGYSIGDTVRFSSLQPPKLRVSGRVKHFISAFGEHVIQAEVNNALLYACAQTGAEVNEFTVAPQVGETSYHEWFIEFAKAPEHLEEFAAALDGELRRQNAYYNDLRNGDMLTAPVLQALPLGAANAYMKHIGKLGGQNKFPRLSNDRQIADYLTEHIVPFTA